MTTKTSTIRAQTAASSGRRSPKQLRRRRRFTTVGAAAVLGAVIVAAALVAGGGPDETTTNTPGNVEEAAAPGRMVPAGGFEMLDGSPGSFVTYRGRPLVVNFFASWCAPCLAELPGFERVHQDLDGRVAFLGLNLQDRPQDGRRVVEATGITYDVGRDPSGELFRAFRGLAMPTTVFVDADGRIVDVHSGELSAGTLQAQIEALLLS
jgi:thiol-disulfide isomerase/thioredoxin